MSDSGDTNINFGQQSVGINKGLVHISAPQPSVSAQELATNEKGENGYVTRVGIHLDQPYAAQNLAVLINKTTVKSFDVRLQGSGMMSIGGITFDGGQGKVINAPLLSDYVAEVVTEEPVSNLGLEARLNVQVQEGPPPA